MKGILEFDLPDEEGYFVHASYGTDYYFVLYNVIDSLRTTIEKTDNKQEAKWAKVWYDKIFALVEESELPHTFE